jgi:hypothetical protein
MVPASSSSIQRPSITAQLTEPYKSKLIGAFLDGTLTDLFHPVAKKENKKFKAKSVTFIHANECASYRCK